MNPLDFIDIYEQQAKAKIQGQTTFTSYEVEQMIMNFANLTRKAVYNGEFVFSLEDIDNQVITVSDTQFNMRKIMTENNKHVLILQMLNCTDIVDTDFEMLSEQIKEAAQATGNVAGVLILPPNFELSLFTAKTDIKSYASSLGFTKEDLKLMEEIKHTIPK